MRITILSIQRGKWFINLFIYATTTLKSTGKPHRVVSDNQPDAREGQAGRFGVAERFVVLRKPGNAGGGKGP